MAEPLTSAAFLAALKAEGVKVVEVGDWRNHNRNHKGPWGPVYGSVVHHTVTSGTAHTVSQVRDGYASLPGPLCHGMIAKNGTVHLVGYGRTNHAGGGDPAVLGQVIAESYASRPTAPTKGNADGVDGNAHFYGWECENLGDGKDPWPKEQYDAIVRVQAALVRAHRAKGDAWGLEAKSVIGHLEWSQDKIDPRGFSMVSLRADVAARLKVSAGQSPVDKPADAKEDAVEARDVWAYKNTAIGATDDAYGELRATRRAVDALKVQVSALETSVLTDAQIAALADRLADVLAARLES